MSSYEEFDLLELGFKDQDLYIEFNFLREELLQDAIENGMPGAFIAFLDKLLSGPKHSFRTKIMLKLISNFPYYFKFIRCIIPDNLQKFAHDDSVPNWNQTMLWSITLIIHRASICLYKKQKIFYRCCWHFPICKSRGI